MAQVRFAATIAVVTLVVSTMAVTGCSLRSTGGNVGKMESAKAVEVVASAKSGRYMSLFASAMDAIGWVVPLPFSVQGEKVPDSQEVRFSDISAERDNDLPKYRL